MKKKSPKKIVSILLVVLATILLLVFLITNVIVVNYSSAKYDFYNYAISETESHQAIIVLGCGVTPDRHPTPLLSDRLDIAILIYKLGIAPKILMSGDGQTDDYNEVAVMREYAIYNGVNEEDILIDPNGISTYDTFYRAANEFGITDAVIVTQDYHLSRALYIAGNMGIEAVGVRAQGHVFKAQLYYSFRELFARTKDCIYCLG